MHKLYHLLPLLPSYLSPIKPVHRFAVASAGPAPSYDSAALLALPGYPSAAQQRPPGLRLPAPRPADTVADVSYIHPTTYYWKLGY